MVTISNTQQQGVEGGFFFLGMYRPIRIYRMSYFPTVGVPLHLLVGCQQYTYFWFVLSVT